MRAVKLIFVGAVINFAFLVLAVGIFFMMFEVKDGRVWTRDDGKLLRAIVPPHTRLARKVFYPDEAKVIEKKKESLKKYGIAYVDVVKEEEFPYRNIVFFVRIVKYKGKLSCVMDYRQSLPGIYRFEGFAFDVPLCVNEELTTTDAERKKVRKEMDALYETILKDKVALP